MTAIAELYEAHKKPLIPLKGVVALMLATPNGIKAQEKYLNGDSPEGNDILDRGEVARVIREEAGRHGLTIHASIKTKAIMTCIMREQRKVGIPLTRTGRIDLDLLGRDATGTFE